MRNNLYKQLPTPSSWLDWQQYLKLHQQVSVVMLSRPGCPYCEAIRREQLLPLANQQTGNEGAQFVEFDVTNKERLAGNSNAGASQINAPESANALAKQLGIRLAPTLLFVGWAKTAEGPRFQELADRLVGYGSRDFFSAYLAERIALAQSKI
jgi:thiol-disulfide isomerase/thioredoxin